MSSVYPISYPGSPSSPLSPAITASGTSTRQLQSATNYNGHHGSLHQRKESDHSAVGRPSFGGFMQYGGTNMSRQNSHASLAPTDATIRHRSSDIQRRGTAMTMTTQYSGSRGYRSLAKQQKRPSDGSWATMDPDEVFRRLHVAEVKKVEARLRATAGGKQAELRAMVSERYRDLLLSTTQIATIHDSSLKLSQALDRIETLCSNPAKGLELESGTHDSDKEDNEGALAIKSGKERKHPESSQRNPDAAQETDGTAITEQLPSAAAVKFLLDAPEAMYRFLSSRAYLQAAFLWLLARTVKEYMLSPQDDSSEEEHNKVYMPLVQKQWETLVPLRAQVVHKATASMRDLKRTLKPGQEQDRITFVQTLLAVMLLDSNTSLDALNVFLNQRARAIDDIFTASQFIRPNVSFTRDTGDVEGNSATPHIDRPKARHTRQASRLDAAQILRELSPAPPGAKASNSQSVTSETLKPDRKDIKRKMIRDRISKALLDTVKCITNTVGMSKSSYLSRSPAETDSSLLDDAIDRVQRGERKVGTNRGGSTSRHASISLAQRRLSRLPYTLPVPPDPPVESSPYVSASTILKTLPSSQMLLTYLPESVQMFTPFIAPTSGKSKDEQAQQVIDKLDSWVSDAISDLAPRIDIWLSRLDSISDIWKVRSHLFRLLDDVKHNESIALSALQVDGIRKVAQSAFETRTKAIWRAQMDQLSDITKSGLKDSLEKIRKNDTSSMTDLHPSLMYFSSPMHFPSVSVGAFMANNSLQANFVNAELPRFRADLRTRLSHRTHLLQERLDELERSLSRLQIDASTLERHRHGRALAVIYRKELKDTLSKIVDILDDTLQTILQDLTSDPISIDLAMFIGRFAMHLGTLEILKGEDTSASPITSRAEAENEKHGSADNRTIGDIQRKSQQVYLKSTQPWKARTLEDALQIFRKAFNSQPYANPDIPAYIFNALADMVAAVLDSGAIQPQRTELQKELAVDFANQAISTWKQSGKSEEHAECMALLRCLAGAATVEQAELAIPYIKKVQLLLQPLLEHTLPALSTSVKPARSALETRQAILLPFGQAPISHEYSSPTPLAAQSARFALLSLV